MAFEIIKSIVEAEQTADSIKVKAVTDAESIRADAVNKCESIFADVKKQAKLMEETLIEKAVTDSRILANAKSECLKIEKTAEERKSKAIEAVIGKVVR